MNTYSSMPSSQNYIYLYDLPKREYTSVKLAELLKQRCGVELDRQPQVRRDINRPFFSAIITITDADKFKKAKEALRYFEIDGKSCRGLPFDNELLGSNAAKLVDHNVFVRKIPLETKAQDLEKDFEQFGAIKSLKISLNGDHTSRGYGFICFQEAASAKKAITGRGMSESNHTMAYAPKDRRDVRRAFNNIYVKNLPEKWEETDVRKLFEAYGRIESLVCGKNDKGLFAFVCYMPEDRSDREYGPECARKAVEELNGKDLGEGRILYVKEALKKAEREAERVKDFRKFKNSKKRCNLYVKGFPDDWTEIQLKETFCPYGEIESFRMFPSKEHRPAYAFVCYRAPDQAQTAKNELSKSTSTTKALIIHNYEIKEQREVLVEDQKDKLDFQNYRKEKTGGEIKWGDLAKKEELMFLLNQVLATFKLNKGGVPGAPGSSGYNGGRPQNPMSSLQQMLGQGDNNQQHYPQRQQHQQSGYQPQQMPGNNRNYDNQRPRGPPRNFMQQQQPPMPAPAYPVPQQASGAPANQTSQMYVKACSQIYPSVVPQNEMYKTQVGTVIYDYVLGITGAERAPKITGMLIDLPMQDIHIYLQSYDQLVDRVRQAESLLNQGQ